MRSRRLRLKGVKFALVYHEKDFIRSRPPLNPASRRKLAEKSQEKSTHTQLMEEIRSGSILKSVPEDLRPRPEQKALQVAKIDVKNETIQEKSKPKKVIRLSQVQLIESDSEEEDALSLKVGIKNAQTSFDTFTSQKMSHKNFTDIIVSFDIIFTVERNNFHTFESMKV